MHVVSVGEMGKACFPRMMEEEDIDGTTLDEEARKLPDALREVLLSCGERAEEGDAMLLCEEESELEGWPID